jgi:hypothetical protein
MLIVAVQFFLTIFYFLSIDIKFVSQSLNNLQFYDYFNKRGANMEAFITHIYIHICIYHTFF